MKKITKKKAIYTQEVEKYQACDGTMFNDEDECFEYELDLILATIPEISKYEELEGVAPFDGGEYSEDHYYYWFYVDSVDTAKKLNKAFHLTNSGGFKIALTKEDVGRVICIEKNPYGDEYDIFVHYFSESVGHAMKMINYFKERLPAGNKEFT